MANSTYLSVIIPVYNEEKRIEAGLKQILSFLKKKKFSWEIVIVDDGSTDNTVELIKKHIKSEKRVRIIKSNHLGKGGAIKKGVGEAKGKWLIFLDIDLATPMTELTKFQKWTASYDIIIGSRKMKGAEILVRQPAFREFGGRVFTILTNAIVTNDISDVTCGFKLFKSSVAKELFNKSLLSDWSFDAEILYLAQKKGAAIKEVPVRWQDDPHTKVNLVSDTIDAFLGLIKIRLNDLKGRYN